MPTPPVPPTPPEQPSLLQPATLVSRMVAFVNWIPTFLNFTTSFSTYYQNYVGASVVGPVSADGSGNSTGAVMESGTNSDGGYIRYASGVQMAWGAFTSTTEGNRGTGIFLSPFLNSSYAVTLTVETGSYLERFAVVGPKTSTGFKAQSYQFDGDLSGAGGSYIAIGRWR